MIDVILKVVLNYSYIIFLSVSLSSSLHMSQCEIINVTNSMYLYTILQILVTDSSIKSILSYFTIINILIMGPSVNPAKIPIEWASLSLKEPNPGVSTTLYPIPLQEFDIAKCFVTDAPPYLTFSYLLHIILNSDVFPHPKLPNNTTYFGFSIIDFSDIC